MICRISSIVVFLGLATVVSAQQSVSCNKFDLKHKLGKNSVLSLSMATDLPKEVMLTVEVTRRYWVNDARGARSVDLHINNVTVGDWPRRYDIDVGAKAWDAALKKVMARRLRVRPGSKVTRVDRRFKLRIITNPGGPNRELLGPQNRYLSGDKPVIIGDGIKAVRYLRFLDLEMKGQNTVGVAKRPKAEKINELKAGARYALTRTVPLLAHPQTDISKAGIKVIRSLGSGSLIYVDRKEHIDGADYLRVSGHDARGQLRAVGWVELAKTIPVTPVPADFVKGMDAQIPDHWKTAEGLKAEWSLVEPATTLEGWPNIRRVEARIIVAEGLEESALRAQVLHALWDVKERVHSDGVRISAYRKGLPSTGEASAATATLAPEGGFAAMKGAVPLSAMKLEFAARPSYFKKIPTPMAIDTRVNFVSEEASIVLHGTAESIADADKVGKVTAGSRGNVKASRVVVRDGDFVLRYQIAADSGILGWVDSRFCEAW